MFARRAGDPAQVESWAPGEARWRPEPALPTPRRSLQVRCERARAHTRKRANAQTRKRARVSKRANARA